MTGSTPERDECALDAIATLLGTNAPWEREDTLHAIAELLAIARPNPYEHGSKVYAEEFLRTTGRRVVPDFDGTGAAPSTKVLNRFVRPNKNL